MTVFDDTLQALEAEAKAADAVDVLYLEAAAAFNDIDDKYKELRGVPAGKFDLAKIKGFISDNKGILMAAGAAFGIPVGFADSGAFSTITGMFGKLAGLFGIG